MALKCDAVFEGGGVKGIGLVGAFAAIQAAGYEIQNLAGTSAGAIVASLIAVGYSANEIEEHLNHLDYNRFKDQTLIDKMGLFGKILSVFSDYGIYKGDYFVEWLGGLLKAKGKTVFGDIKTECSEEKYKYKFQAIVSDITDHRLMVLPNDLASFGIDPDNFSIVEAVRMSMSIPVFFKPYKLTDSAGKIHYIVDGGVLSNYPIWLLDDGSSNPEWPTFGFKLTDTDNVTISPYSSTPIKGIFSYSKALISTMLEAHDNYHVSTSKGDTSRTIFISTTVTLANEKKKIATTDFDITQVESKALFNNGKKAGESFLKTWNFQIWKEKYRQEKTSSQSLIAVTNSNE